MVYWGTDADGRGEVFSAGRGEEEEEWGGDELGSLEFVRWGAREGVALRFGVEMKMEMGMGMGMRMGLR